MKHIIFVITLFTLFIQGKAQEKSFLISPTVGISKPILDNGIGAHLGVNPSYAFTRYLAVEGQLSYSYTQVTGSFISGDRGHYHGLNALAGGRLYVHSPEKRTRLYVNLLLGAVYKKERENNFTSPGVIDLGFSAGSYLQISKWLIGLSYDTPKNIILKGGYVF